MAACGGDSTTTYTNSGAGTGSTTYNASTTCWSGAQPTSTVSQAAANALVPASCTGFSSAQLTALGLQANTTGTGSAAVTTISPLNIPAGATLAPSTIGVRSAAGNSYSLAVTINPLTITATPALPAGTTFTVLTGGFNYSNAPTSSLVGKTFSTVAGTQAPVSVIQLPTAPYNKNASLMFNGGSSTDVDGTITSYVWNFGDGNTGAGQTVNHSYSTIGQYTVQLTVTDNSGLTHSSTKVIEVVNNPALYPVASIVPGGTQPYTAGVAIGFSGMASTHNAGANGSITSYQWSFGDGTTGSGQTVTHVYSAANTYPVQLTVTNNLGYTHTATASITVAAAPVAPVSVITLPTVNAYYAGTSYAFSGGSSTGSNITSYAWSFGDNTAAGAGQTVNHTYTSANTYTLGLTITNANGQSNTSTKTITVLPAQVTNPTAAITPSLGTYTVGTPVGFSCVGSTASTTASGAPGTISTCAWNFGNGSSAPASSSTSASHNYAAAGTYTVTLTVVDNSNKTATATVSITVAPATTPPTGWPLNDTGITSMQCHGAGADTLIDCTSAAAVALNPKQDGMMGRDVTNSSNTDGKLGFSFATVGNYALTECVKDNVTGLVWEGKTASGARGGSNKYTHYYAGFGTASQIASPDNVNGYVAYVNSIALCGYTDWRMPGHAELQSIVDYSITGNTTIDMQWFPNTAYSWYWTGTPNKDYVHMAWYVYFVDGHVGYNGGRSFSNHVRLVR